jgi:hypothetical protein
MVNLDGCGGGSLSVCHYLCGVTEASQNSLWVSGGRVKIIVFCDVM